MVGQNLRTRLAEQKILLATGIYDALTAKISEQSGAEALYLSGASLAYTRFASPDIGLVSMNEVADTIALIREKTSLPLIVDADNGYGNALNVQRTVRVFERMGADVIQLEDQSLPKRCGHLAGKSLISAGEMVGKIKAALDARESDETLIIARTDAIAVEGWDGALARAQHYYEAGADILFIEAPADKTQMQTMNAHFADKIPLLANMVEGGSTPLCDANELQDMGYSLVIFPGGIVRALTKTMIDYYENLIKEGSNEKLHDKMLDFGSVNEILGTEKILQAGEKYRHDG